MAATYAPGAYDFGREGSTPSQRTTQEGRKMSRKQKIPLHKWVFGAFFTALGAYSAVHYHHSRYGVIDPVVALIILLIIFLVP